jgi:hypothetical protein
MMVAHSKQVKIFIAKPTPETIGISKNLLVATVIHGSQLVRKWLTLVFENVLEDWGLEDLLHHILLFAIPLVNNVYLKCTGLECANRQTIPVVGHHLMRT